MSRLLTAREVAGMIGVSTETVLRWTRRGDLPAIRLRGGALRYRKPELDNWLSGRATSGRECQQPPKARRSRCPRYSAASRIGSARTAGDSATTTPAAAAAARARSRARAPRSGTTATTSSRSCAASPPRDRTLSAFIPVYLERHAANVRARTIVTLRERLAHAARAWGDVPLRDLERMSGDIATWQARLPERSRYGIVRALRQTLAAAVRWGYIGSNPATAAGRNRQPTPRVVRTYGREELDALGLEMPPAYAMLPAFAAATGLRPEELFALERRASTAATAC